MSYDFSLDAPQGIAEICPNCGQKLPAELRWTGYDCDANYTYNVSPMFRLALGGNGVNDLHRMLCSEALPRLQAGVSDMVNNPSQYKNLNPSNGWGNYEDALNILQTLKQWAEKYPTARFRIS